MDVIADVKKSYRLLRRAINGRAAAQRVGRRISEHPHGRFRIAVYFADSAVNLHQIRQWYRPLQGLGQQHPVVVIARSAIGAEALLDDGELPVAFLPRISDLEAYLGAQDIRIVLYVNQNTKNFQMFRYGGRWHVFIDHGESDNGSMSSGQFKAYDFALVAGAAARERLARALWDYDVGTRTIEIGRPQADHYPVDLPHASPYPTDDRTVVLYAPTWEGERASGGDGSASCSSVLSHGEQLVAELLATGRHRLIYRPHPRTGVIDDTYGAASRRIMAAISAANAADTSAHHMRDEDPRVGWQFAAADVAIVDVSAMLYDRLAVAKPLLVTRPVDPDAVLDTDGYLSDCEWLTADAVADVVNQVDRVRTDESSIARLRYWGHHYFGDTTPGAATTKLHAAVDRLMAEWERWHDRERLG